MISREATHTGIVNVACVLRTGLVRRCLFLATVGCGISNSSLDRIERISRVATRFLTCGDYRQGVAGIRCINPECRHEYFRPFSCKGFFLGPSRSQKRTLLFSECLDEQWLLALPHRQFVFTLPKALRVFLRHDQRLFADLARLIFDLIGQFYSAAAARAISTAAVVAYQPFGDSLRFNPHFHALIRLR